MEPWYSSHWASLFCYELKYTGNLNVTFFSSEIFAQDISSTGLLQSCIPTFGQCDTTLMTFKLFQENETWKHSQKSMPSANLQFLCRHWMTLKRCHVQHAIAIVTSSRCVGPPKEDPAPSLTLASLEKAATVRRSSHFGILKPWVAMESLLGFFLMLSNFWQGLCLWVKESNGQPCTASSLSEARECLKEILASAEGDKSDPQALLGWNTFLLETTGYWKIPRLTKCEIPFPF